MHGRADNAHRCHAGARLRQRVCRLRRKFRSRNQSSARAGTVNQLAPELTECAHHRGRAAGHERTSNRKIAAVVTLINESISRLSIAVFTCTQGVSHSSQCGDLWSSTVRKIESRWMYVHSRMDNTPLLCDSKRQCRWHT